MRIPAEMDGVPGLSFAGIAVGQTFVYRFPLLQNGTYWYHSHHGAQEQIGLIGALIIEPRDKDPIEYDRDYVVLLSDWTDTDRDTLYANLKKQSDYYNYQLGRTHRLKTAGSLKSPQKNRERVATRNDNASGKVHSVMKALHRGSCLALENNVATHRLHTENADIVLKQDQQHFLFKTIEVRVHHVEGHLNGIECESVF